VVSGDVRCSTAVGGYLRPIRAQVRGSGWAVPQRLLHPASGHLVVAIETLRVDLEQHLHGVTRLLGYLRRRHSPVEPGRYACMPQVTRGLY
jgi:hypothetical protein